MTELSIWVERALTPDRELGRVRLRACDGRITELCDGVDPDAADESFPGATLVPGLVDLQVNGGDGGAFADPDGEGRARASRFQLRNGTTSFLATLVSASLGRLTAALARLAEETDPAGPMLGVHLEGPFLAPEKAGAHEPDALCDPTPERVGALLEAAGGTLRLVTLAPERAGAPDAVETFAAAGAVVAAGHSRATLAQVRAAIERGLSFVTHVGNASDWPSRAYDPDRGYRTSEPGLVGSFLVDERLSGSVIADGLHLHPELIGALVRLRGPDRVALVSDATPAAGLPPGRYGLGGLDAEIHPAGHATAGEGLAGSTVPLAHGLRTAVRGAGLSLPDAVRMATLTPARIAGVDDRKGRLDPGCDADLLLLDAALDPLAVYRRGERV